MLPQPTKQSFLFGLKINLTLFQPWGHIRLWSQEINPVTHNATMYKHFTVTYMKVFILLGRCYIAVAHQHSEATP